MQDRFLFMMSKIQNRVQGHIKRELKKAGLSFSPGQIGILLVLDQENQTTMGQIGQALEMDNAAITRLVDRLEIQKLVFREINPRDRRQMLISITTKGLEHTRVLKEIARAANDRIKQGFSKEDMAIYKRVNQAILEKFQ